MRLSFGRALLLSLVLHAALYGGGLGWLAWQRSHDPDGMEIDLGRSTLLPMPANLGGQRASRPPEDWFLDSGRKFAPAPTQVSQAAQALDNAPAGPPCPPPCPSTAGDWAPASQAVKRPTWMEGQISESDYPREARFRNQTGLVLAEVLLDSDGKVRDAKILQGSHEALNAKTLEKLAQARFSPCVDGQGRPFPCRLRLPIRWTLE